VLYDYPDGRRFTVLEQLDSSIITKHTDGTTITDFKGHWHIDFPPNADRSMKACYENGTTVVVDKDGKVIKRLTRAHYHKAYQ
jgi:hypothetical protein